MVCRKSYIRILVNILVITHIVYCYNKNDNHETIDLIKGNTEFEDIFEFGSHHNKIKLNNIVDESVDPFFSDISALFADENKNKLTFQNLENKDAPQYIQSNQYDFKQVSSNKVNDDIYKDRIDNDINRLRKYDFIFYIILAGCTIAGIITIIATGFCLYTIHKNSRAVANVDYNPKMHSKLNTTIIGDRRLAQSAQMYHYQHQKQQVIAMEKASSDMKQDNSDNSEGETEEGDYTVYECPGLAPTGEMEVKNPLFKEEITASEHTTNTSKEERKHSFPSSHNN